MASTPGRTTATLQAPQSTHLQMALPGMVDDDPLWRYITSEPRLISLACALGTLDCGGPLSAAERALCASSGCGESAPPAIVEAVRQSIRQGADPLGDILCALRPGVIRRQDGAFYTPAALVDAMVTWLLAFPLARVVDPGCGSGRFTAAVLRRRPDMAVIAVDADPLATLLTRATLAVLDARSASVLHHDYLTLGLQPCDGRTGYIANPPYVRHHDLPAQTKAWALQAGKRLGLPISGLSGLHTLFYLATALQARDGDVGCFVTSAEWLDTRYGEAMRRLLIERLGLRGLTMLAPKATPFADAMATALVTCFTVGMPAERVALSMVETLDHVDLATTPSIERQQLVEAPRWGLLMRGKASVGGDGNGVPLRSVARVHRGVATGDNSFFVLSRQEAAARELLPWCRPAITRAEEILSADGIIRDSPERRLLLVAPRDVDRRAHPALDAYLRSGEQPRKGKSPVAAGYLASHRKPWWYLGPVAAPAVVASYMARQAPAFAYNPDGLVLLNIAHGLYPHQPMSAAQLVSLVQQLNAARHTFSGHGRTYQGGLEKFEPREMEELAVHELA